MLFCATSYGRADGINAIYIKRHDDAVRDGDPIRSLIRSTAVNSNGKTMGMALPSHDGQEAVIRKAYKRAGLNPADTPYIEAHGTGTKVGDAIELEALSRVFNKTQRTRPMLVGSVKTNLGHGEASSGLTSIIKSTLVLETKQIPATIGVKQLNPKIKADEWGVEIVTQTTPLPAPANRISVNSFGYGGANAHAILETVADVDSRRGFLNGTNRPLLTTTGDVGSRDTNHIGCEIDAYSTFFEQTYLLPFSANKLPSLQGRVEALRKMDLSSISMMDLAYTLGQRRSHLSNRGYIVAKKSTLQDDINVENLRLSNSDVDLADSKFAFVFTGQGAQWKGMARELMQFATFSRTIHQLDNELASIPCAPPWKIYDVLMDVSETCPINQAEFAQPITTAVQVGIIDLLRGWSIHPEATVGHSSGEIGAAYAAGMISARQAIIAAYYRGYSVTKSDSVGLMAAIGLGPDETNAWINKLGFIGGVRVACINSPESVTISGDREGVHAVFSALQAEGVFARELKTDGNAYHSHHMVAVGETYEKLLADIWPAESEYVQDKALKQARMFSTVICQEIDGKAVRQPGYWRMNLESPVRFSEGLALLSEMNKDTTFVEIGPHSALKMPILSTLGKTTPYLSTLSRGTDSSVSLLSFVGDLFTRGFKLDFTGLEKAYTGRKVEKPKVLCDLPTYPWHYEGLLWSEARLSRDGRFRRHPRHELLGGEVAGGNKSTYNWRNVLNIDNVPWLRDHKLGDTTVFPAAGYMAMAVEALVQTMPAGTPLADKSVVLRHVDFLNALPLNEEESIELYTELRPVPLSNITTSSNWWDFQISSISEDVPTVRARGSVKLESTGSETDILESSQTRVAPQSKNLWYDSIIKSGLVYGPTFQQMEEIYTSEPKGVLYAEAKTKSLTPQIKSVQARPRYIIHPTLLDNMFQVGIIACTGGLIHSMVARVPTRIVHAKITLPTHSEDAGLIRSTSKITGLAHNRLDISMFDAQQRPVVQMRDIDATRYTGSEKMESRHPLLRVSWKPDVEKISDDAAFTAALDRVLSVTDLKSLHSRAHILAALDMVVHKNPDNHILCMSQDFALAVLALMEVLEASLYHRRFNTFSLGRLADNGDLEVAELREFKVPFGLHSLAYKKASASNQYGLVILPGDLAVVKLLSANTTAQTIFLNSVSSEANSDLTDEGFSVMSSPASGSEKVQLIRASPDEAQASSAARRTIIHVCQSPARPEDSILKDKLSEGFNTPVQQMELKDLTESSIPAGATVISTVELQDAVFAGADDEQFNAIKQIIVEASKVVWVTGSGPHRGCDPTLSMFAGLARAVMVEQPSTKLYSLELDPQMDSSSLSRDIVAVLNQKKGSKPDYEYIRDSSSLMISRTIPDERMNGDFRRRQHAIATKLPLSKAGSAALSLQKPGQLSTAQFMKKVQPALAKDSVRIKVQCIGLNAKDVYALLGKVQTTAGTCSLEGAGRVVDVGSDVTAFAPGDKVAFMNPGYFGTYETVPSWTCVKLRDDEDVRTMASVLVIFLTAIYGLYERANLQPGESVLIHSAAGGVGIATIQVAKLIGADIFATVGTDEKKQYLIDNFQLEPSHIFRSHDPNFASDIKKVTSGRGVDVILNSLAGELLHESWDCLADFGRFIEIGKRDLSEAGRLNMKSFLRGTTFTAFDLTLFHDSKNEARHRHFQRMLQRVMTLLRSGEVQPVQPMSVFDVSNLKSAFNYFNNSKRMGKIVISFENQAQMIPVVPERFSTVLDPSKSYLLVGCLGGLGRSVSKWMFDRGARHFVFIGRTGTDRPAAKRLVDDLEGAGANCVIIRGNVTSYDDVVRAISAAPTPLAGVIQAAMGLNEAIFQNMPRKHWISGTEAKVKGTWNLHNALAQLDKEQDLDFFALTSSISGKVGTATEGNYCAANNFLDSFARFRRSQGLTAVSFGLGMISEVGYLHENPEIEDMLLRKGIRPITEDELLQIFDLGLSQPPTSAHPNDELALSHVLTGLEVTGLQDKSNQGYDTYWQFLDDARFTVLISALRRSKGGEGSEGSNTQESAISKAVESRDEETLVAAMKEVIATKMSSIIMLPVEKLDIKTPLADFGMDSMLAAELRQYIFGASGVDVPFLTLMDKKTNVLSLAKRVTAQLLE